MVGSEYTGKTGEGWGGGGGAGGTTILPAIFFFFFFSPAFYYLNAWTRPQDCSIHS